MQLIENGWVWISWKWNKNNTVTVYVDVKGGKIIKVPPILNKFLGQPIRNLYLWVKDKNLIWIEYKEEL
jgi:hypothetical protein